MHNPAQRVFWLRDVLPAAAIGAELRDTGDPQLLYPDEAACLGRAVAKRREEFAAGRLCARRALSELGIAHFPLKAADDRQPIWPAAVVGSITHTQGLCLAAVAPRASLSGIGLDSEIVGRVGRELWDTICTASEIVWLKSLESSQQVMAATLLFAVKEAFYKCQFPTTAEWLNFEDLEVRAPDWSGASVGDIEIGPTRKLKIMTHVDTPFRAHYRFHEDFVTAGVAFAAKRAQ